MNKPEILTNKEMAEAIGGYDFRTADMKRVCLAQIKKFEPLIQQAGQEVAREILKDGYVAVSEWIEREHGNNAYSVEERQVIKDAILRYLVFLKSKYGGKK